MVLTWAVNTIAAIVASGTTALLADLVALILFTICSALTGALGGIAYNRLYVARLK
jgi:glucose-6-phosphate-specific signal transduction histidine kinase